ncbi:hypothetical protein OROHE_003391 [Orobanche hederae]
MKGKLRYYRFNINWNYGLLPQTWEDPSFANDEVEGHFEPTVQVMVDFSKDIQVSTSSKSISEIPPVVVTAINLKTIINEKHNVNEIVSTSVICCHKAKMLPSSHMDMYEGFGSIVVFNPVAGLIAVPAENYHVQLYSLFDDREISEVIVMRDV